MTVFYSNRVHMRITFMEFKLHNLVVNLQHEMSRHGFSLNCEQFTGCRTWSSSISICNVPYFLKWQLNCNELQKYIMLLTTLFPGFYHVITCHIICQYLHRYDSPSKGLHTTLCLLHNSDQQYCIHEVCLMSCSVPTTVLILGRVSGEELTQLRATFSIESISFCIWSEKFLILMSRICSHASSPESVD